MPATTRAAFQAVPKAEPATTAPPAVTTRPRKRAFKRERGDAAAAEGGGVSGAPLSRRKAKRSRGALAADGCNSQLKRPSATVAPSGAAAYGSVSPFPAFDSPTPDQCAAVHRALCGVYGAPKQQPTGRLVMDSLVKTILSQNTTDKQSHRAFLLLKEQFPTYRTVLDATPGAVEDCIRCCGLAAIKTERIRAVCSTLIEEGHVVEGLPYVEPSLEFLRDVDNTNVHRFLSRFKGVGEKTVACVLMFCLGRNVIPVDTHVWKLALKLRWVPKTASRDQCHAHLEASVPDAIKYDLHILLVEHGKRLKNELGTQLQAVVNGTPGRPSVKAEADIVDAKPSIKKVAKPKVKKAIKPKQAVAVKPTRERGLAAPHLPAPQRTSPRGHFPQRKPEPYAAS
eukprot:m.85845 g.85845  ORF g.85845 m.85845 type:complete len:396 (-) comp14854_c0_seq4:118-1305(-)